MVLEGLDLTAELVVGARALGRDDDGAEEPRGADGVDQRLGQRAWDRLFPQQKFVAFDPQRLLAGAVDDLPAAEEAACRQVLDQQAGRRGALG